MTDYAIPPCPMCEKSTEGSIEVMLAIRFPITGVVHRGLMHLDCAMAALRELQAQHLDKAVPADATKPETKPS